MTEPTRRVVTWGGVILGIAALVVGLALLATRTGEGVGPLTKPISADDHGKGNPDAKVVLVEYSDFQCPSCAATYPMVKQLSQEFGDKLYVVYRHLPIKEIHANAELAARAAEAAGKQGKFWDMHDIIFNTQVNWGENPDALSHFNDLADSLGINTSTFLADIESAEVRAKVNADYQSGVAAGVSATPTFFLNGQPISISGSYEQFRKITATAIEQNP